MRIVITLITILFISLLSSPSFSEIKVSYSLVVIFSVNGVQFSESSEHDLSEQSCSIKLSSLSSEKNTDSYRPPYFINDSGDLIDIPNSNPTFVCVPTSSLLVLKRPKFDNDGNFIGVYD